MTDPVADMLTRIRNAVLLRKKTVDVPFSHIKHGIAHALEREGYISGSKIMDTTPQKTLRLSLKYGSEGEEVIMQIQSVSTPGRRVYRGYRELEPVLKGIGIQILSTPQGIFSDVECRQKRLGGEVLAKVF